MNIYRENYPRHGSATGSATLDLVTRRWRQWHASRRLRAALARERRQLREMADEMLRDIGVSRGDAELESRRSDIPRARVANP